MGTTWFLMFMFYFYKNGGDFTGNGTQKSLDPFETGRRIKECRKMRGLTREQLVDKIELLPDNGEKGRSEKQLGYLENGKRKLSLEYAALIAQALQVRIEYLLLKDDFMTEDERISYICQSDNSREEMIEHLIKLHGYSSAFEEWYAKTCHLQYPPGISDDEALKRIHDTQPDPVISITSPSGATIYLERREYFRIVKNIDDYIEMQLSFLFRKRGDAAKEYWG